MRKIIHSLLLTLLITTSGMAYSSWHIYGPTLENEHLYRIALRVRPAPVFSVQQMMVALLDANPSAFNHHNINGLKSGYQLRIPGPQEVARISHLNAVHIVNQQNREWLGNYPKSSHVAAKVTKSAHLKHARHEAAIHPVAALTPEKPEPKHIKKAPEATASSLIEIANGQQASNASLPAPTAAVTPTESKVQETASTNDKVTDAAASEKMDSFIAETKKYEVETNTQLANLQQQTRTLQTSVTQVNKDLQTLTYQFIQLTNKTKASGSNLPTKMIIDGLKKNAIGLSLGLLALILLSYLLKRSFRPRATATARKDEYDYMGSKESIPSKLDLASAYIDMGDYSAAEVALKEVLAKGNEEQKKGARDLLGKMNQR
ncbi:MAG: hypothetical protein H0U71_02980 [Gammaproteobacteria bacterium]|nr:hypothetical protein [Gammaproteobacteria bacterium]